MAYTKWCICGRRILSTGQMKDRMPCDLCQKEHAEGLAQRVAEWQKEEEK